MAAEWFDNAVRYHSGGIVGLAPDEVPAILRRGEEVLTAADSRHRDNGDGRGEATAPIVKVVNAFDAPDMLEKALGSPAGEKVLLNWVNGNQRALRGALG